MNEYAIVVYWSEEDSAWIAEAPDLRPCAAHGDTAERAVAELRIAIEAWLDRMEKEGTVFDMDEALCRDGLPESASAIFFVTRSAARREGSCCT